MPIDAHRVQLRPARRHGADARRPLRGARLLGPGRLPRRARPRSAAPATSSSTCCSRGPTGGPRWTSREAFDAVGGDLNAFTAKEYTCYYARVLDRDLEMAVEHLADMLAALADPAGRPRGRAPGDPGGDPHARGLARGRRARPVHRGACGPGTRSAGRSSARSETIEAAHAAIGPRASTGGHYVPGNLVVAAAGNVRHDDVRRACCATGWTTGRRARRRRRVSVEPPRAPATRPAPSGGASRQAAQDRAGAHRASARTGSRAPTPTGSPSAW